MPPVRLAALDLPLTPSTASILRLPQAMIEGAMGEAAADADPANKFMRLFHLLQALGQDALALDMQAKALRWRCLYRVAAPPAPAIRLLALMGPGNMLDNTPLDFVVEGSDIRLDLLYVVPGQALPEVVPDHDLAIVALAESDKNVPLLARLEEVLSVWPRPVLNTPRRILHCARDTAYGLLCDIPGLLVARTQRLERARIGALPLPITVRPLDTHGGKGLMKIEAAADLDAYLSAHADPAFYVSDYIDYRSADGLFRKLRIALIDGRPYICHLAIAEHWMVHYIAADMQESALKRAEEAATMQHFDQDFGARHGAALRAIAEKLGLDYVILDCGETRDGRLLLFEADTRGWIHAADPVDLFPYKPAIMQKAFDAFRAMLARRMARPPGAPGA